MLQTFINKVYSNRLFVFSLMGVLKRHSIRLFVLRRVDLFSSKWEEERNNWICVCATFFHKCWEIGWWRHWMPWPPNYVGALFRLLRRRFASLFVWAFAIHARSILRSLTEQSSQYRGVGFRLLLFKACSGHRFKFCKDWSPNLLMTYVERFVNNKILMEIKTNLFDAVTHLFFLMFVIMRCRVSWFLKRAPIVSWFIMVFVI